jgi:hypothetical protein
MAGYRPYVRREPGTLFDALERGIDQVGGAKVAADLINRTRSWLDDATNPNREEGKRGHVSLADAAAMSRAGATAFAEYLVECCGGQMLPPISLNTPKAVHGVLADIVREGAEAIGEMIQRAADGEIDIADAKASIAQIDDVVRAYLTAKAMMQHVIDTGETLK